MRARARALARARARPGTWNIHPYARAHTAAWWQWWGLIAVGGEPGGPGRTGGFTPSAGAAALIRDTEAPPRLVPGTGD